MYPREWTTICLKAYTTATRLFAKSDRQARQRAVRAAAPCYTELTKKAKISSFRELQKKFLAEAGSYNNNGVVSALHAKTMVLSTALAKTAMATTMA